VVARRKKQIPGATHVLSDIVTQEVSMVDRAANLRRFLTIKRDDTMGVKKETSATMMLPAIARQTLIESVADAVEKLVGVTQALKDAEIDDTAEVPNELPIMLRETAKLLEGTAQKFIPAEKPVEKTAEQAEAEKAMVDCPDCAGTGKVVKAKKADEPAVETEKAKQLTTARRAKLIEARDMIAALLDETNDGTDDAKVTETAKSFGEVKAAIEQLGAGLKAIETTVAAVVAVKKSADDLVADVAKLKASLSAPGESRGQAIDGDRAGGSKPEFAWPEDMSAATIAKRKAARV